jgi:hypothetical protein
MLRPSERGSAMVALPYARRQRIVVVDDEVLDAELVRTNESAANPPQSESLAQKVLRELRPPWPSKEVSVERPADATAEAVASLHEDGVRIMLVSYSQAEALNLPVGHPRDKVVYVGDPASPLVYYPAADFHRKTFEHKFSEAILLLMALGATELVVHAEEGWGWDFATDIEVPIPKKFLEFAPGVNARKTKDSSLLFHATLKPNAPEVPDGLVWYPRESAWRQVATGRIDYGLNEFSLQVRYTEDYGIDTGFESKVKKVKLNLGGEFKKAKETTWRIEGVFGS